MLRISNPTSSELSITYKGKQISVSPNGFTDVEDEVASYWKKYIHEFIIVEVVGAEPEVAVEPEVTPEVKEVVMVKPVASKKKKAANIK